jgi:hypothetical protein
VTCPGEKYNLPGKRIWPETSGRDSRIVLEGALCKRWELRGAFKGKEDRAQRHTIKEMRDQNALKKKIGLEGALSKRWGLKCALKKRR